MKRKALVLAICMAFASPVFSARNALPSNTVGLNLGEIQSTTFLNEPFNGQIPILFSSKADARLLKVRLAPASIFSQVGAERLPMLSDLDFDIAIINNKPVIQIRSINAIELPFLNFVLEIERKQGRKIYQDFTVMLDPRGLQAAQPKSLLSNLNTGRRNNVILPTTHSSSSLLSKGNQTRYTIQAGDSLSKIAHELKASGISLNNIIKGIRLKNPQSFSDINKIVKGEVINLPTFNELRDFTTLIKENTPISSETETIAAHSTTSYKVNRGDTLYKITRKFMHSGTSFTKLMNSIHINNPHAFSQNRINILIAGAVLKIPAIDKNIINSKKSPIDKSHQKTKQSNNNTFATVDTLSEVKSNIQTTDIIENDTKINKSSDIVESLEKRVRELRNKLSKVTNDFSSLENTLNSNESLLLKQQSEVKLLKLTISSLKEGQQASTNNKASGEISATTKTLTAIETPIALQVINKTTSIETKKIPQVTNNFEIFETPDDLEAIKTPDTTKNFEVFETADSLETIKVTELIEAPKEQRDVIEPYLPEALEATQIPSAIENLEVIDTSGFLGNTESPSSDNESVISKIEKLSTFEGIGYALLLLVFGILAIRFRKKSQSYASIPNDQPTYYKEDKYAFTEDKYSFTEKTPQKDTTNQDTDTSITRTSKSKTPIAATAPQIHEEEKAKNSSEEKVTYKDAPDQEIQVSDSEIQECEVLVDSLLGELLEELEGGTDSIELELSDNKASLRTPFDKEIDPKLDTETEQPTYRTIADSSESPFNEEAGNSSTLFDLIDNTLDERSNNMLETSSFNKAKDSIDAKSLNNSDNSASDTVSHSLDDFQDFQSDLLTTTQTSQLVSEKIEVETSFESVFDDLINFDYDEKDKIVLDSDNSNDKQETNKSIDISDLLGFDSEKSA